jgi:hypothetical protein
VTRSSDNRSVVRTDETSLTGTSEDALAALRRHLEVTTVMKRSILDTLVTFRASVPPTGRATPERAGLLCWWFVAEENPRDAPRLPLPGEEHRVEVLQRAYFDHLVAAGLGETEARSWVCAADLVIRASVRDGCVIVDRRQDWLDLVATRGRWSGSAVPAQAGDSLDPLKDVVGRMGPRDVGNTVEWLLGVPPVEGADAPASGRGRPSRRTGARGAAVRRQQCPFRSCVTERRHRSAAAPGG